MRATTKTRVQRRVEKKQAILLVVLVLVISVASFALGLIVGRHTAAPAIVEQVEEPRRIIVAEEEPVAPAQLQEPDKAVDDKLTFYENLSKEEPAPLGSGINLPPESEKSASEKTVAELPKAASAPEVSRPTAVSNPVTAKTAPLVAGKMPAAVKGGEWVVQVFASQSAADAGILRDKLSNQNYSAFIAEVDLGKKGIWYRVYLGPYRDKTTAEQAQLYAEKTDKLRGFAKRR